MKLRRSRLLIVISGVALYAGPLVYMRWAIHEAHFVAAAHSRPGEISVLDYGAKADGLTDDGAAFEAAFADAARHNVTVEIPRGTYLVNREIQIEPRMIVRSEGATLKHTDNRIGMLSEVRP